MSTNRSSDTGTADQTNQDPRQRHTILIAASIALMAVIASVSGLNVAQPVGAGIEERRNRNYR